MTPDPDTIVLEAYLLGPLMRDLVGHDHMPSAYLVLLALYRLQAEQAGTRPGSSLQTLVNETGLSKSAVQRAVRHLTRRGLLSADRETPTSAPRHTLHQPWRRSAAAVDQNR